MEFRVDCQPKIGVLLIKTGEWKVDNMNCEGSDLSSKGVNVIQMQSNALIAFSGCYCRFFSTCEQQLLITELRYL